LGHVFGVVSVAVFGAVFENCLELFF